MFRTMTKDDLQQMLAVEQSVSGAPWNEEVFNACFDLGYLGWVVEYEKRVVGFVVISLQPEECHILNICVAREFQRQGLGRHMLEYVLEISRESGAGVVYLEVRRSNTRAIALYRKLQFQIMGERKDYYQTVNGPEDALVFAASLKEHVV